MPSSRDILLIEDSLAVATLIRDFLNKLGYENIHLCENGITGIQVFEDLVKSNKMPVVLLDYGLPDMDGGEVMKKILEITPDAKIILETASDKTDETVKDVLRHGAYGYIQKPIRFDVLKNTMYTLEKEESILAGKHTEKQIAPPVPVKKKVTAPKSSLIVSLVIVAAIIISAVVLVQLYQFKNFSTVQIQVIKPVLYVGILIAGALAVTVALIRKKMIAVKSDMSLYPDISQIASSNDAEFREYHDVISKDLVLLESKIKKLEKVNKKTTISILVASFAVALILGLYVYVNYFGSSNTQELISGRFLVQDLKGDIIDTWISWTISPDETLQVTLINSNLLPPEKIAAIKEAILSEESVKKNPMVQTEASKPLTYYKGWKGALNSIKQATALNIPHDFKITEARKAQGDIVIILSEDTEGDGSLGFTRSIADKEQHQILKSTITIFNVKQLTNDELATIVRHEFGHAIGLAHSTAKEDLMAEKIPGIVLISPCDLDAIKSLYNEQNTNQVTCKS